MLKDLDFVVLELVVLSAAFRIGIFGFLCEEFIVLVNASVATRLVRPPTASFVKSLIIALT